MQRYAITIFCDPEICSRVINYTMDRWGVGGRRKVDRRGVGGSRRVGGPCTRAWVADVGVEARGASDRHSCGRRSQSESRISRFQLC